MTFNVWHFDSAKNGTKIFQGDDETPGCPLRPPTTHTQPAAWPSPARGFELGALLPFHVPCARQHLLTARFPPLFLPGRAQRGPLQGSIRSATFWPATRIPGTQQGLAAKPGPSACPHVGLQPSWPHGKLCWATGFTAQQPPWCRSPG